MIQKVQVQIIANRLYYLADINPPKDIHNAFFFNIDKDLTYDAYYEDFGPLNLARIWKYINQVTKILNDPKYEQNIFYHHCSPQHKKCTNAALLICAYQVVILNKTAQQAFKPFQKIAFKPFRDAGYGHCTYKCTILQCLKGLQYAIKLEWFDFKKFDLREYEHYEQLENGDVNWIVPGKIAAFSSPYDETHDKHGNRLMSPKDYLPIFNKLGIKTVIRLNSPTYDRNQFIKNGINHQDLYFPDGTAPSHDIVLKFLDIVQKDLQDGAVAVHCKAGLGRTGSLIGCYVMKHYKFFGAAFIGWIRLCRPGSILGPQQYFLIQYESKMHQYSQNSPVWKKAKKSIKQDQLQELHTGMRKLSMKDTHMSAEEKHVSHKGQTGQGTRLVEAKKKKLSYQGHHNTKYH